MRYRKTLVLLVVAAAAAGPLVPASEGQQPQGEYKIGILEPLTGFMGSEGKRALAGYEMMRDIINARGGVMGKKLTFAVADAANPTAAANEANRLITREGVRIISGTFASRLCGAASEAAARHNVIYWETSCTDPRFTNRGLKPVFRTVIDGTGLGWYMVEFAAKYLAPKLNMQPNQFKVVFLSEDSSYGQGVSEAARERAKREFGMIELAVEYYSVQSTNDFTPILSRFKQLNPDIVFNVAQTNDGILFWRQAKEQNFVFKALVSGAAAGFGSPDFGPALKDDANGTFAVLPPGPGFRVDAMRPEGQQIERAFREAVHKATGAGPVGAHQYAAGGLWILKLVLDRARTDELTKFREAALSFDLPVGSSVNGWGVKFGENGQMANERGQHYVLQWQSGQLVTVWPEEFTTHRAKWIPLGPWDHRK